MGFRAPKEQVKFFEVGSWPLMARSSGSTGRTLLCMETVGTKRNPPKQAARRLTYAHRTQSHSSMHILPRDKAAERILYLRASILFFEHIHSVLRGDACTSSASCLRGNQCRRIVSAGLKKEEDATLTTRRCQAMGMVNITSVDLSKASKK